MWVRGKWDRLLTAVKSKALYRETTKHFNASNYPGRRLVGTEKKTSASLPWFRFGGEVDQSVTEFP